MSNYFFPKHMHMSIERAEHVCKETHFWCALTTEMVFFFFWVKWGFIKRHPTQRQKRCLTYPISAGFQVSVYACGFLTICCETINPILVLCCLI
jgi:hypothetical protein